MQKRTLKDLINTLDPAWPLVQEWVTAARNNVEVLPSDRGRGEEVLLHLQVTTRSPLGAVALETGGILIDHGWLRFLGSGHERMHGNLLTWNTKGEILESHLLQGALIVTHDVVGGIFALNGGAFPGKPGTTLYFAPDTLSWKDLNLSYSQLLNWATAGDVELFYQNLRWPDWEQEVSSLSGDQGISIYPFLFAERGVPVSERSRRVVPMHELWHLHLDLAGQLRDLPDGAPIQVNFVDNSQDD